MILADAFTEAERLSRLLDGGIAMLRESSQTVAEKERDYRKAKAQAWLRSKAELEPGTIAKHREAWVDAETADLRFERDVAEGVRSSAKEAVRGRQQQISMLQSLLNAHKAEAEFARTGPR